MKKLYWLTSLLIPISALAQTVNRPPELPQQPPITGFQGVINFLNSVLNTASIAFVVITFLLFLWTAYLFLTAGDNPDRQGKARKFLLYAVIGVVVSLFTYGIFKFVNSLINESGGGGGGTIPSNCLLWNASFNRCDQYAP